MYYLAVSPFLLHAGLALSNQEYVDFAVFETIGLFSILRDEQNGLLHQARGFQGYGTLTEDNWSRGNGWGAFALAILVRDLPESHPRHNEVIELARNFFMTVLKYQNEDGLWHQEMTDPNSYVETSGSGMLLYGLGIMLEKGLINRRHLKDFKKGLSGFTSYIGTDGSVSHTCMGCLSPGNGTKEDYINHPWAYNDPHSFGPVVLAFTQAAKMGIELIAPLKQMGLYSIADSHTPRAYIRSDQGRSLAWENDRIAFRVFCPEVREKVGSGIDVWAKSVEYSILDKWYRLNEEGKDYHTDRGEGCDFYNMGKRRGCGGLAIWIDGIPYPAETLDTYRIRRNQDDIIEFILRYNTWKVPGLDVRESKMITMETGTSLFRVTSIIESAQDIELIVAIGLTTFGDVEIYKDEELGILSVWEQIDPGHGDLGSAVLVNPEDFSGFASYNGDEFILIKVQTNVPFVYHAGAGWSESKYFEDKADWEEYVTNESDRIHGQKI